MFHFNLTFLHFWRLKGCLTHFTVFFDPVLFGGFWNCDNSVLKKTIEPCWKRFNRPTLIFSVKSKNSDNLNTPAYADLRRRPSILFSYLENCRVVEDLTFGQWTVPFNHNSLLTTVIHQFVGLLKRMVLHLVSQRDVTLKPVFFNHCAARHTSVPWDISRCEAGNYPIDWKKKDMTGIVIMLYSSISVGGSR